LCLEGALSYDDPGRHDLKKQAISINDLRLQSHPWDVRRNRNRLARHAISVRASATFPRDTLALTRALMRGFAAFCMPVKRCHDLRRA
jgi:hypothetical protein